ncbi:MAG: hypothetical protein OEY11_09775 [Gammaproteobacteria bacterium]|nr:hypothetical protein [Gammaproteobacteria bacterium]
MAQYLSGSSDLTAIIIRDSSLGIFLLLACLLVVASVIADVISHILSRRFSYPVIRLLWEIDTAIAGTLVLFFMLQLLDVQTRITTGDYFIVILYYGLLHAMLNKFIYWNKSVGIKSLKKHIHEMAS